MAVSRAALLALCACDSALHLSPAVPADALGTFVCPPIGTTPRYATDLHQVFEQDLLRWGANGDGTAVGCCYDTTGVYGVLAGRIDMPIPLAAGVDMFDPSMDVIIDVTIGGDGTMFVSDEQNMQSLRNYRTYAQSAAGTWSRGSDFLKQSSLSNIVTIATTGPTATTPRHFLYIGFADGAVHEKVDDGAGGWSESASPPLPPSVSMLQEMYGVSVSGDGLRVVVIGFAPGTTQTNTYYSDRPSIDAPFRVPDELVGVPAEGGMPYMTDDCARVYVFGLGRVFYLQQI